MEARKAPEDDPKAVVSNLVPAAIPGCDSTADLHTI